MGRNVGPDENIGVGLQVTVGLGLGLCVGRDVVVGGAVGRIVRIVGLELGCNVGA